MQLQLLFVALLSLSNHSYFSRIALGVAAASEVEKQQEEGSCAAGVDGKDGSCSATGINDDASDTKSSGANASADNAIGNENNDKKKTASKCQDQHEKCEMWADLGECDANPPYMHVYCKRSCELCDDQMYVS